MDDDKKLEVQNPGEQITEGELVEQDNSQTSSDQNQTILESLEGLIRDNLSKIDKLKEEANQHKEMIDSALANDEVYKQHEEAAKAAAKTRNATKQEILKRPENSKLNQKLRDLKAEIKEIQDSMDSYLQEYRRLSGSDEIETDGGPMQIIYKAVLVRRKS